MDRDLAEHISLMAASLYAVLAAQERMQTTVGNVPPERLTMMRRIAIEQAHALWLDTLDYPTPERA